MWIFQSPLGLAVLAVATVVTWAAWYPLQRWKYRAIPGPFGLPFLGSLVTLVAEDATQYYLKVDLAKKYGPVFKVWFGSRPWVVVSEPDAARKLENKFLNRPDLSPYLDTLGGEEHIIDHAGLLVARGELWRTARKTFESSIIHPTSLAGHVDVMASCANKLVARIKRLAAAGKEFDMFRELGNLTLAAVGEAAYGVNFGTLEESSNDPNTEAGRKLVESCGTIFEQAAVDKASIYVPLQLIFPGLGSFWPWIANVLPDRAQRKHVAARQTVAKVTRQIMASWKAHKEGDGGADGQAAAGGVKDLSSGVREGFKGFSSTSFLAACMEGRDKQGSKMSEIEIIAQSMNFILGGYETTANAMAFTIYLLANHPEAERQVAAEIAAFGEDRDTTYDHLQQFPYLEAVVKEALRLYPPGAQAVRENPEDYEVHGYTIPKGSFLVVPIHTFHHSPAYWTEPEKFMPERFLPGGEKLGPFNPSAYIPFGQGARMCVGHKFAMMEAKLTLIKLYKHFTFRLAARQEVPIKTKTGITQAPVGGVWVHASERV